MATRVLFAAVILVGLSGCRSYHYIRESTPLIEQGRMEYVQSNPNSVHNEDILDGLVREGMSRLQVRMSWGEPDQVRRVKMDDERIDEVWAYSEDEPSRGNSVYELWFTNSQLRSIEVQRAYVPLTMHHEYVDMDVEDTVVLPASLSKKPQM